MIILVLAIYTIILLTHLPPLIKKKYWRDTTVFFIFYTAALTLSTLFVLDIKIPSPAIFIKFLVEDIFRLKY